MEHVITIRLFYPMLFTTIIVLGIIVGLVITKTKDNGLFNNIFNKHTDEHIDTTNKMKDMHDKVIQFTPAHEKEIHLIETKMIKMEQDIIEIRNILDDLLAKYIEKG